MKYSKIAIQKSNTKYHAVLKKMFMIYACTLTIISLTSSANANETGAEYNVTSATDGNAINMVIGNTYQNQSADKGGAIYNSDTLIVIDSIFSDNQATWGSAIHNEEGRLTVNNSTFSDNIALYSGAISSHQGTLTVNNSTFFDNQATLGGAIYTTYDTVSINNSVFSANTAVLGGAIYNYQGNVTVTDSTFTGNQGSTGGAIYNNGTLNLFGTNTFIDNTINGVKNDIYNTGTLNISGTLALDGGITGNGIVNFADGTNLKTTLLTDASSSAVITANTINGNINLVIEKGSNGGQVKFDATNNNLTVANNNALYNIEGNDTGLFNITKKSSAEVAASTGVTENQADMLIALTSDTGQSESFNTLTDTINELVQSSDSNTVTLGVNAASTLASSMVHIPVTNTIQNTNQIFNAVNYRLSGGSLSSMSGLQEDVLGNGAIWVKTLYNKSKLSTHNGFDAYTRGIALGTESHIHDQVKIGVGYAYVNSDIKPTNRKNEINSNAAILYGEYKPNDWFVNAITGYIWSRNDDHKYVLGYDINAKYNINSYSAQIQTGYDFDIRNYTITPEIGLRYMNINQKQFTDSIGNYTNANKSDIFTGIIGATTCAKYFVNADLSLKPKIRLAAKYDFVNDNITSVTTLANKAVISSQEKSLKRLSGELGFGLSAIVINTLEVGIGYQGEFRKRYADNTGLISAKYNF